MGRVGCWDHDDKLVKNAHVCFATRSKKTHKETTEKTHTTGYETEKNDEHCGIHTLFIHVPSLFVRTRQELL